MPYDPDMPAKIFGEQMKLVITLLNLNLVPYTCLNKGSYKKSFKLVTLSQQVGVGGPHCLFWLILNSHPFIFHMDWLPVGPIVNL